MNDHKFRNPYSSDNKRSLYHVLLWMLGYYNDPEPLEEPPDTFSYPDSTPANNSNVQYLWVGHSTFLIKACGYTFLTDPVWANRLFFIKRKMPPGISLKELPPIDFVLISHNHYDHLDIQAVRYIHDTFANAYFLVPLGLKKWLEKRGITRVHEYNWWQSKAFSENIQITSVPAQHFSGRGLFDRNRTLWCGFVVTIKDCFSFYFAGDTGYNEVDFKAIGSKYHIDLALLPIGGYCPRAFMSQVHLSPDDAVRVHSDLGAKKSVACHFGTFKLSDEPLKRPPYDLFLALNNRALSTDLFSVPKTGLWYSAECT